MAEEQIAASLSGDFGCYRASRNPCVCGRGTLLIRWLGKICSIRLTGQKLRHLRDAELSKQMGNSSTIQYVVPTQMYLRESLTAGSGALSIKEGAYLWTCRPYLRSRPACLRTSSGNPFCLNYSSNSPRRLAGWSNAHETQMDCGGLLLARLCEQGFLVSDNRRRWTNYRLGGGPLEPSLFDREGSTHLAGDSSHLPGDSLHMSRDSSQLSGSMDELTEIAAPVAEKGKSHSGMVRDVILRLCAGRYLTAEELGTLLHRNPDGLRNRYLSPMVSQGLLRLRYPTSANRPDQAYTSAGRDS